MKNSTFGSDSDVEVFRTFIALNMWN